jgi:hypothetical protein
MEAGSPAGLNWFELNGLSSKACVMLVPVEVGLDPALITA